jgi:hypothetical protein
MILILNIFFINTKYTRSMWAITKVKNNSRLLDAIYETANDFHNCGVFNQEQMQKYNELCLSPVSNEANKVPIYSVFISGE